MKNLQLITLLLLLFLSLTSYQGVAQQGDLARVSYPATVSNWASSPERVKNITNPLTASFSVMPKITVNDEGNVFVYIYNPNHTNINIHLHDQGGNALHRDKTTALYYGKLLNVSELIAGEYMLTLNSDKVSARYAVKIRSEVREIKVKQVPSF